MKSKYRLLEGVNGDVVERGGVSEREEGRGKGIKCVLLSFMLTSRVGVLCYSRSGRAGGEGGGYQVRMCI